MHITKQACFDTVEITRNISWYAGNTHQTFVIDIAPSLTNSQLRECGIETPAITFKKTVPLDFLFSNLSTDFVLSSFAKLLNHVVKENFHNSGYSSGIGDLNKIRKEILLASNNYDSTQDRSAYKQVTESLLSRLNLNKTDETFDNKNYVFHIIKDIERELVTTLITILSIAAKSNSVNTIAIVDTENLLSTNLVNLISPLLHWLVVNENDVYIFDERRDLSREGTAQKWHLYEYEPNELLSSYP